MVKNIDLIYFSPTGGTLKCAETLCKAIADNINYVDLGQKDCASGCAEGDLAVIAAPVFGGRIPSIVTDRLKDFKGDETKTVTMAVYGTRAYEDALLELNNIAKACNLDVIASAAVVAEHSIVRSVGSGRPDADDEKQIEDFARKVAWKIDEIESGTIGEFESIEVPGNFPYKDGMKVAATPICTEGCVACGHCMEICPTGAISIKEGKVETRLDKCLMCMACVSRCPSKARMLPVPVQAKTDEHLKHLISVRRDNEFYI